MKNFVNLIVIVSNLLLSIMLSMALSACDESSKPSEILPLQLDNQSQIMSKSHHYSVTFSPPTTDIPLNQYFDMVVYITGSTQQVLTYPLDLEVDAGMKAHHHGMNVSPKIINLGRGQFKVDGMLFHMPGDWFLKFIIHRGMISDKAEINLVVSP